MSTFVPSLMSLVLASDPAAGDGLAAAHPQARSQGELGRARLHIAATRIADDDIKIDGRVRTSEWGKVAPLPEMIQVEPEWGARPHHPTEVRIAYGERGLYVAFIAEDDHGDPKHVRGAFGRKDQVPTSDRLSILIDPTGDGVTGYFFEVNPSGAQSDAYIFRDNRLDGLWDGVWSAAARRTDRGWSAEMFIPWSTMRFRARESHTFGIDVGRFVNIDAESQRLSPAPQGVPGLLSYAARYEGVTGIRPGLNLELRPFLSTRFAIRRAEGSLDQSWRVLPNAGIEAKYGLRGNLTMDVAVNPDFGQAEVDPAVLNLGPFEVFFPERRQFFLESKELFETRFNLFYTRRVGNNPSPGRADISERLVGGELEPGRVVELEPQTRILEAVRVTGEAAPGWRVGALTATTGPTFGTERFSDGFERPITVDPTIQWSVARVRREFNGQSYVGAIATAVTRMGEQDAYAGGLDYAVRFRERWTHEAQVIGTHDGEDAGVGASGGLWRSSRTWGAGVDVRMLTPSANFNDAGFMQYADYAEGDFVLEGYTPQPLGPFRQISSETTFGTSSTFDGVVFRKFWMNRVGFTTRSLWSFNAFGGGQLERMDPFETRGGIPYQVPLHWWTGANLSTPFNRRVIFGINGAYGQQAGTPGPDLGVDLVVRPVDRLEINVGADFNSQFGRPRWVARSDAGEPVFGRGRLISTNSRLRLNVGITPTLTLQSFNQLLYSTAHHDTFWILTSPTTLMRTDPGPYFGIVDQALTALISNSVLRWEYLPGSFLFVVYTHRTAFNGSGMVVDYEVERAFTNLVRNGAQHEDILFVKLSHLFAL